MVKVYVEEPGFQETREIVLQASSVATSLVTYVEMRSALARKLRMGEISSEQYGDFLQLFERNWLIATVVPVSNDTVLSAGILAERHGLRALDALHLASATGLASRASEPVVFLCADANLIEAATQEGLPTSAF